MRTHGVFHCLTGGLTRCKSHATYTGGGGSLGMGVSRGTQIAVCSDSDLLLLYLSQMMQDSSRLGHSSGKRV